MKKSIGLLLVVGMVSGCSSLSKLTINEYKTAAGQTVAAGRYKPEAENQCQIRKKTSSDWGFKGHLDPDGRYNAIATQAAQRASSLKANYIYIHVPSGSGDGSADMNNSVAGVIYYACKKPPN